MWPQELFVPVLMTRVATPRGNIIVTSYLTSSFRQVFFTSLTFEERHVQIGLYMQKFWIFDGIYFSFSYNFHDKQILFASIELTV
jgi:hypothetical protein